MIEDDKPLEAVRDYYNRKIERHGATARGVDWRDHDSQQTRFGQLATVMENDTSGSVIDWGCGYGAMGLFLRGFGWRGSYEGIDVSPGMIQAAQKQLANEQEVRLTVGRTPSQPADFVLASGIFNVKISMDTAVWENHVFQTIDDIVLSARRGVAFNFLTAWSDEPLMREDLYYASPEKIFTYCAARHSRWLEISQDYGLFEFTVRMRLDRPAPRLRIEKDPAPN